MPTEKIEYALVHLEDLRKSVGDPRQLTARIKEILANNFVDYECLDLSGQTSSADMRIEVDRLEIYAQINYARKNYKQLVAAGDEPDPLIGAIKKSLARAAALKAKYPDREEFQKINVGYNVLDEMNLSTDEAIEAQFPQLKHAAHVGLARRAFGRMLDEKDVKYAVRLMPPLSTNLKFAFGGGSAPGCYAALDETGKASAKDMIKEIIRRAGRYLSDDWNEYLLDLIERCEKGVLAGAEKESFVRLNRNHKPTKISADDRARQALIRKIMGRRTASGLATEECG